MPVHNIFGEIVEGKTPVPSILILKLLNVISFSTDWIIFEIFLSEIFPRKDKVRCIFSGGTHLMMSLLLGIVDLREGRIDLII